MIHELSNVIKPYAWGSRRALAELRGETSASSTPEAELWMGAHPLAPSRLLDSGQALDAAIAAAPAALLGSSVAAAYADKLPFLLKILAADTPLSLQAHPSLAQASAGFAADEAAKIPLDASTRNYKDANHKPELLCALSEFWALCGFRQVEQTLLLFDELGVEQLASYREALAQATDREGIARVFAQLMQAPRAEQAELAAATSAACRARASSSTHFGPELGWGARIGALYPGDVGVVSALMLNLLKLEPGEAIYLPAGNLHAYLGGTGVEIMASSDNVLRGGLTPKHVDVPELLRVLDFSPLSVTPLRPEPSGLEHVYDTPAREFRLSYFELGGQSLEVTVSGPEIWLVTAGTIELSARDGSVLELSPTRSVFASADTGRLGLRGSGRIFRAKVAQPG
jgi:mannose-6-phosphate isomerase